MVQATLRVRCARHGLGADDGSGTSEGRALALHWVVSGGESSLIYRLPAIPSNREGFERLGHLAKTSKHLFADELMVNMSQVNSFDANMAAPLGAVLACVADEFNSVRIVSVPSDLEQTLRENQFLTYYRYDSVDDVSHTTMPFRRFRLSDEGAFEEYVGRLISSRGIPKMSKNVRQRFKRKIFEVYQNAIIHSESTIGVFVCGQVFPDENRLDFTIADGGIGIRDSVRRYFRNHRINSIPALKWALQPSHTTKRGNQPGGLGLQFLREFSDLNQGRIRIVSRFAFYEYHCGDEDFQKMSSNFPGTAVTIQINTVDTGTYVLSTEICSEEP